MPKAVNVNVIRIKFKSSNSNNANTLSLRCKCDTSLQCVGTLYKVLIALFHTINKRNFTFEMKVCVILAVLALAILATVTMSDATSQVGEVVLSRARRSSMNKCPPHAKESVCKDHCNEQKRNGKCRDGVCTCVPKKK